MAIVAAVGCSKPCRDIRSGNPEAVVVPAIDYHVCAFRHVARRARELQACCLVVMMARIGVLLGGVTLQADAIARHAKLGAMWVVTIAACHAGSKHPALLERCVVIDLIKHLSVGLEKPANQR